MIGAIIGGVTSAVNIGMQLLQNSKQKKLDEEARKAKAELDKANTINAGSEVYAAGLNSNEFNDVNDEALYGDLGGTLREVFGMKTKEEAQAARNKRRSEREANGEDGEGFNMEDELTDGISGAMALGSSLVSGISGLRNMKNPDNMFQAEIDTAMNLTGNNINKAKQATRGTLFSTGGLIKTSDNTELVAAGSHKSGNDFQMPGTAKPTFVEGQEVIKDREKVYSNSIINPATGRPISEEADRLSKIKAEADAKKNTANPLAYNTAIRESEIIDKQLDDLFQLQERIKLEAGIVAPNGLPNGATEMGDGGNLLTSALTLGDNIYNMFLMKNLKRQSYDEVVKDPTLVKAQQLETEVNVDPQLNEVYKAKAKFTDDIEDNVRSSAQAIANERSAMSQVMDNTSQIYDNKNKLEVQLRNQNKLNKQQVDTINAQFLNQNAEQKNRLAFMDNEANNQFNLQKTSMQSANVANMADDINNAIIRSMDYKTAQEEFAAIQGSMSNTGVVMNNFKSGVFKHINLEQANKLIDQAIGYGNVSYQTYKESINGWNENHKGKNKLIDKYGSEEEYNKVTKFKPITGNQPTVPTTSSTNSIGEEIITKSQPSNLDISKSKEKLAKKSQTEYNNNIVKNIDNTIKKLSNTAATNAPKFTHPEYEKINAIKTLAELDAYLKLLPSTIGNSQYLAIVDKRKTLNK